jgi:hypothetical protein
LEIVSYPQTRARKTQPAVPTGRSNHALADRWRSFAIGG